MTYQAFADCQAWETSRREQWNETCMRRKIEDFKCEMWHTEKNGQWRWAAKRDPRISHRERSLYGSTGHKTLDTCMADFYMSLTRMGWMPRY